MLSMTSLAGGRRSGEAAQHFIITVYTDSEARGGFGIR
jgi:hypothetical protein